MRGYGLLQSRHYRNIDTAKLNLLTKQKKTERDKIVVVVIMTKKKLKKTVCNNIQYQKFEGAHIQ